MSDGKEIENKQYTNQFTKETEMRSTKTNCYKMSQGSESRLQRARKLGLFEITAVGP